MVLESNQFNQLVEEVKKALLVGSQGVGDVEIVDSLADIVSLPALRLAGMEESVVEAPLELLSAPAEEAAEEVRKAEAERVIVENARKEAEKSRETAETKRASSESTRASAETTRINAEKERVTAEGLRKTAETERGKAEASDRRLRPDGQLPKPAVLLPKVNVSAPRRNVKMLRQCGPTQSQPDRQPKRVVSMLKPVVLQQKVSALLLRMPEVLLRIHVIVRKLTAKQPKPDA